MATPTFSARELELLAAAMRSLKGEFAIDYAKFAENGGFKNANSARVAWHPIKKKLEAMGGDGSGVPASPAPAADGTPKAKATPAKGKKRKGADAEVDDAEAEVKTPASKKGKKGKKSASPVKKDESAEAEEKGVKSEPDADY